MGDPRVLAAASCLQHHGSSLRDSEPDVARLRGLPADLLSGDRIPHRNPAGSRGGAAEGTSGCSHAGKVAPGWVFRVSDEERSRFSSPYFGRRHALACPGHCLNRSHENRRSSTPTRMI